MEPFVLDASVTMSWFLEDEFDAYSEAVKDAFVQGATAVVPSLWPIETTHVLLRAERRGRVSSTKALELLALLKGLPVEIDKTDSRTVFSDVWFLAKSRQLSAYDATYLELALRRRLPLATLDSAFQTAAQGAGVNLFLK
jgi:predicted nucleic acid-binding protein